MSSSTSLSDLPNIGPRSQEWLNAIGLYSLSDLENVGAVEVYQQLRELDFPVTLNLVYAVQGAIMDCPWNHLPTDIRVSLKFLVLELDVNSKR
ncbi:MAG: hypothetical protein BMS9Abin02_2020 [Anaerolineae bacterium]|nr:MAG: hypothetical protein BMS9Abin02_2020 [Anaerolineae bacterium]